MTSLSFKKKSNKLFVVRPVFNHLKRSINTNKCPCVVNKQIITLILLIDLYYYFKKN